MPLIPVPVTALYAGLLALLAVILALVVVSLRRSFKVGVGDGGNRDLAIAIRVHGNAIENIPLFLVLLGLFELNHGSPALLHLFGGLFFLSRVLHAWGLYGSGGVSFGRAIGIGGTLVIIVALAIANIARVMGKVLTG